MEKLIRDGIRRDLDASLAESQLVQVTVSPEQNNVFLFFPSH